MSLFFFFFFFFFFTICLCSSSLSLASLNTTICNGTGDGADPDAVVQLISCLVAKRGGYCEAGQGKNITHGFSQCVASVVSEDCSACLQQGGDQLLSKCKGHGGGRIYTDKCVLFYQPRPFSGDGGGDPVKGPECGDGAGAGAGQIGKLLDGVLEKVTSDNESFAAGVDGAVFAMAQCWGSAGMACGPCLGAARDALIGICGGAAAGGVVFDGCLLRYQDEPFDSQRREAQLPPPPTYAINGNETRPTRRSNEALFFFLGGLSLLLVSVILLMICWKSKGMNKLGNMLYPHGSAGGRDQFSGNLRIISYFDFKVLKKATSNFELANQIGSGGFGPVYQGKLDDGRKIAVKKLAVENSQQGESEFLAEVRMITSIQHKNLVRLLGCCSDGSQRLLVYEYMKNRSLDSFIYGGNNIFLNWQIRFQIILGIARGLQYLHEDSHMRIVHRDIKASNILLDEKFQPKIGDFGLARFFPEDQAYLSTKFAGTIGYTAPEYAIRGELSEKADIYSYGVLVLEIISSRKNTDLSLPSDMQYLPEYAWKLYEKLQVIKLIDPMLVADGYDEREVLLAIHVTLLCMQPHPALRPPMSEIVAFLTCKAENIPTPVKPAFLDRRRSKEEDVSWEDSSDGFPTPVKINSPAVARPGNRPS